MFEISQLKEKKLPELQEIAKELKVPKFSSLKKIDLVYQILDLQAANPTIVAPTVAVVIEKSRHDLEENVFQSQKILLLQPQRWPFKTNPKLKQQMKLQLNLK